mmetsp:Transcript_10156/g.29610  ORF Transcript_10156/g.29610 Transcript_10156/m.29610 type:complete len:133 (-) Transcript_10156:887-1285(-)|eukprot:scaffold239133_cov40-Tisochrysis_lutea.AAC.2
MGNVCSCFGAETEAERRQALLMADHTAQLKRLQDDLPHKPLKTAHLPAVGGNVFMSPVHENPSGTRNSKDDMIGAKENVSPNHNERTPDGYYAQTLAHSIITPPNLRSPLNAQGDYSCVMGYGTEYGALGGV